VLDFESRMYCKTTVISCFLWSVNKYIQNDFYFIELNEGGGIALSTCFKLSVSVKFWKFDIKVR
jgi:hypothetical protein